MHRYLIDNMSSWLDEAERKPLVLRGARQVGKTWLVRALARASGRNLIEINFERQRQFIHHFESNEPKEILANLQGALGITIDVTQSILFLDEIQAAPELLAKLRWFYELMPELPVVAAGSLLEFALEKHSFSMPVGRIQYMYVEPLGFYEYLMANQEVHLLDAIKKSSLERPLNQALHEKSCQLFRQYMMVGGMPEAVAVWSSNHVIDKLMSVQSNLISTYQDDFAKYAGRLSLDYLSDALQAIPKMLAHKFVYSHINPNVRHAALKQATELLTKSRLCHKVKSCSANGIPLNAEVNPKTVKMILLDIGLILSLLNLRLDTFKSLDEILLINEGGLAEQVIGQLLRLLPPAYVDPSLFYWQRQASNASAEIDYVLQHNQHVIPIEVKAGSAGKMRSLHQFIYEKKFKLAVRIYSGHLALTQVRAKTSQGHDIAYRLLSVPFYLTESLSEIIANNLTDTAEH